MDKNIIVGKIFNAHGIKGEIKVFPMTDDTARFKKMKSCIINGNDTKIESVKLAKDHVILKLENLNDRDEAIKLKGTFIEIEKKDSVPLNEGEHFIEDLKGLKVINQDEEEIGVMKDVLTDAPIDVYVFNINGKEKMLAAIKENILEINEGNYIKINTNDLV